jgi:hypothetical protein
MNTEKTQERVSGTLDPFVGNFPCPLSPSGVCKYGGNKHFNYGFMSGTSSYCRKAKRWVHDLDSCPISNAAITGGEPKEA